MTTILWQRNDSECECEMENSKLNLVESKNREYFSLASTTDRTYRASYPQLSGTSFKVSGISGWRLREWWPPAKAI
jgi:hypothetical protein